MAKYEIKTRKNQGDVQAFLGSVDNEQKRLDSLELLKMMESVTKQPAVMWGSSIVGFGSYHYKGRSSEGEWMAVGFSPRKQNLTIYIMPGFDKFKTELGKLGKHTTSVGCLYIAKLADVDQTVLKKIIKDAYEYTITTLNTA